jgi:light-regulated signal transduction histidine kinase (bacteriophytochrome)
LRAINGYTGILEEELHNSEPEKEEIGRLTDSIKQNVSRMNLLIDDLLEFSRLGKKPVDKTMQDMGTMVKTVIKEIEQNTPHRAKIKVDELLDVPADFALMVQVWTNLISNGIKYSAKKESPVLEISSTTTDGHEIIYCVKDNGAGFDMRYVERLFGVFQRLHAETEFEGTGIGLAIVQRIVAKHGGRVWAEGKLNEGASFYFSLPGE